MLLGKLALLLLVVFGVALVVRFLLHVRSFQRRYDESEGPAAARFRQRVEQGTLPPGHIRKPPTNEARPAAEWELLRALCSGRLAGPARREVLDLLAGYTFSEPVRQAVFDALGTLAPQGTEVLRAELPARLTRRGFPEVNFEALFTPTPLTVEQAVERARELAGAGSTRGSD